MNRRVDVRKLTVTAMLSAIAFVLMFIEFGLPIIPSFIKLDISELPALIGAFAIGPGCGVAICLIKNLLHLLMTSTAGVGELSNFILGASFTFTAGYFYKKKKTKGGAVLGAFLGALIMGIICVPSNYFVVYPFYEAAFMPEEVILGMYQAIVPSTKSILQALILFNMPFTIAKGLISTVIACMIYKPLSPILHGTNHK